MRLYVIHFVGDLLQGPAREIRGCSLHTNSNYAKVEECVFLHSACFGKFPPSNGHVILRGGRLAQGDRTSSRATGLC